MTKSKITELIGKGIPIKGVDIDTDQVMPARFMTEITFDNMGNFLFYDARNNADGTKTEHPLNDPKYSNGSILIVGKNFGCGSSREHAPQAIKRYGIKAIIGESFAEIFAGNCKALGIPVVKASKDDIEKLWVVTESNPNTEYTLNLEQKTFSAKGIEVKIDLPDDWREAFVSGNWDVAGLLLANNPLTIETIKNLIYFNNFVGA
jgi:3-isopropylmalate/(R)-2-methylmalate dehydratase small subunit